MDIPQALHEREKLAQHANSYALHFMQCVDCSTSKSECARGRFLRESVTFWSESVRLRSQPERIIS